MILSPSFGNQPAMVVFVDHTECHWLRGLKGGFRHCFVALEHESGWLVCDSLKNHMELRLLEIPKSFDLATCYVKQGHRVLIGRIQPRGPRRFPALAPLTCVSVAKRLLSVSAAGVWTPWQLFRHLLERNPQKWQLVPLRGED